MSSASSSIPSMNTSTSNILNTAATSAIDSSDPYDSISTAMLYNSSIASISTNLGTGGGYSSSFLVSQETLCDTSSPPSLYLSSDVFHFPDIASANSSIATPDTYIVASMGTSSFASSNKSSSSLNLSINCPVAASASQDHSDIASAVSSTSSLTSAQLINSAKSSHRHQRARSFTGSSFPSNEAVILQAIQNASSVSPTSSLTSARSINSPQSSHRHQRARSFSLSPSVSQQQGVGDHRETSLTRKNSIASTTSISSAASSNYSERTTPSIQIDQSDPLANVSVSRRGSHLLLTAEQLDEIVDKRIKELLKQDEWILICDETRESLWKKAVTEKDKKIVTLVERSDVLEHSLNISSKQSKYLWAQLIGAENQYFDDLAVKQAKYQIRMEKLNEALSAAKNQSAQTQQELNAEKSKIEKLLKVIETIFGNHLESYSRSRNSVSSDSQTSSSTSSLSTSSASSDSAPKTEALQERPSSRTESASSQKPQYWFCVIC